MKSNDGNDLDLQMLVPQCTLARHPSLIPVYFKACILLQPCAAGLSGCFCSPASAPTLSTNPQSSCLLLLLFLLLLFFLALLTSCSSVSLSARNNNIVGDTSPRKSQPDVSPSTQISSFSPHLSFSFLFYCLFSTFLLNNSPFTGTAASSTSMIHFVF